jgi:hypothetical protein
MTTTTNKITKEQAQELAISASFSNDIELSDGVTLRYRLENDDHTSFHDFDCYGKVSYTRPHPYRYGAVNNCPDDFDGTAELLNINGSPVWWQPPLFDKADRRRWHTDERLRNAMRQTAMDILNFGFYVLVLEVTHGANAYGEFIVTDYATIGGIEPFPTDEYLAELIYELAQDLDIPTAN